MFFSSFFSCGSCPRPGLCIPAKDALCSSVVELLGLVSCVALVSLGPLQLEFSQTHRARFFRLSPSARSSALSGALQKPWRGSAARVRSEGSHSAGREVRPSAWECHRSLGEGRRTGGGQEERRGKEVEEGGRATRNDCGVCLVTGLGSFASCHVLALHKPGSTSRMRPRRVTLLFLLSFFLLSRCLSLESRFFSFQTYASSFFSRWPAVALFFFSPSFHLSLLLSLGSPGYCRYTGPPRRAPPSSLASRLHPSSRFFSLYPSAALLLRFLADSAKEERSFLPSPHVFYPALQYGATVRVFPDQRQKVFFSSFPSGTSSFAVLPSLPSTRLPHHRVPGRDPSVGRSEHPRRSEAARLRPMFPSWPASFCCPAGRNERRARRRRLSSSDFASAQGGKTRGLRASSLLGFLSAPSISPLLRRTRLAPLSLASSQPLCRDGRAVKEGEGHFRALRASTGTLLSRTLHDFTDTDGLFSKGAPTITRAITEGQQGCAPRSSSGSTTPLSSSGLPDCWGADLLSQSHFPSENGTDLTENFSTADLEPTTLYDRGPRIPHVELHPKELTGGPEPALSEGEKNYLWRHGYFRADAYNETDTWKNWHLLNRGGVSEPSCCCVEASPSSLFPRGATRMPQPDARRSARTKPS